MPRDTTVIAFRQPEAGGARRMLAQVLIAEADSFIAMWKDLRLPDGRRAEGTAPVCSLTYCGHRRERARRLQSLLDCAGMSDRHLTRIRRLTALCLLFCAVVIIGLAISGALKEARSPVPQLASHK
jgi:hypothetical protein